ncbi:hypothetical protein [Demequina muriae]|uniref:Uncharacterized protein n=1 Tax=Demequina muriae TaxID=3051664 RepID=A0ABT8GK89_9MICO|nr:hypothetical protein [Demequina sp. EGI L300058]MDN4481859.1 hypothetical protein [Demequina sp. EGI L300058]
MAAAMLLTCSRLFAQQVQLQHPDIVGSFQRGYAEGQAARMRNIEIQQAQEALRQQQAFQAQQEQEQQQQQEVKRLAGVLLLAQTDDERWAALNKMAAIDPALAVQYMQALHMDQPNK